MCQYKLLAHNSSGYIIQCKECEHFRFAFGTNEVVMNDNELQDIYGKLCQHNQFSEKEDKHRKTIRIALFDSRIMLALTPLEAKEMADLIDEAQATSAVNLLLRDFH